MVRMLLIAVALVAATLTGPAVAQTPPDAAEVQLLASGVTSAISTAAADGA